MKILGGPMHRANSHECLFAFIDFTVKIKRLINLLVAIFQNQHSTLDHINGLNLEWGLLLHH